MASISNKKVSAGIGNHGRSRTQGIPQIWGLDIEAKGFEPLCCHHVWELLVRAPGTKMSETIFQVLRSSYSFHVESTFADNIERSTISFSGLTDSFS